MTPKSHNIEAGRDAASELFRSGVLVTCGSGGVGKTTMAAALGVGAAMHGVGRVLVLTIDPARRLATALGLQQLGNAETPVALPASAPAGASLHVAMLDTSASWDSLVRRHAPDERTAERIVANQLYRNITQRFVQSHDYIAMERLHDLVDAGTYDLVVIDTPPSRHAIDFLDAPERMRDFFSSTLLKWITMPYRLGGQRAGKIGYLAAKPFYQVADRILGSKFLEDIAEFFLLFQTMYDGFTVRAEQVTEVLRRPSTRFVLVATPDPAPLHEAEFFLAELAKRKLHVGAAILNRVVATEGSQTSLALAERLVRSGASISSLSADQQRIVRSVATAHLEQHELAVAHEQAWQRFATRVPLRISVRDQALDITDVTSLEAVSRLLTGGARTTKPTKALRTARGKR
jgi:anion-transporting  ArsA/GET3 family ATPase